MSEWNCFAQNAIEITESVEKIAAIKELIWKASVFSCLKNRKKLESAVLERERLMSTAIGHGVAVAHGKTKAVDRTMLAFGISRHGIRFDAPDGKPVHLLFLVANPPKMCNEYLRILSAIARITFDENLQEYIRHTESVNDVIDRVSIALSSTMHEKENLEESLN